MSWLKRNLYFVVGGVVAAALLGLAGWYCFSKWQLNNQKQEELQAKYAEWTRIIRLPISPGNDQVNNIENAIEQQKKVRDKISREAYRFFEPIAPIPNPSHGGPVSKDELAFALRATISQLQKDATNSSVNLSQPSYAFSFKAQLSVYNFPPGSIAPLSTQLGEVKAICDILFRAKINSLDNLQRERVTASSEDVNGPQSDYLEPTLVSITNELAVLTPYVITFHGFSAEVASVLTGFSNDRHGFIVKTINVEPGGGAVGSMPGTELAMAGGGLTAMPMMPQPGSYNPYAAAAAAAAPPAATGAKGPPVILDEKPLKVTMVVVVVKLLPRK
jgi:hypothetical protein